jgi:hypothetical protein
MGVAVFPQTPRRLVEHRARHEHQLLRLRAMRKALGETSKERLPTAVLARGIAYQELLVKWLDDLFSSERWPKAATGEPKSKRRRASR